MITAMQYFKGRPFETEHAMNAEKLLQSINALLYAAAADGAYDYRIDPDTNSQISGAKGGTGDGGYRPSTSTTGAPHSAHRVGCACDVYDPDRKLALWCDTHRNVLEANGLYMEHLQWTPGWCHLQDIPPGSGQRVYRPSMSAPIAPPLPGQQCERY